MNADIKTKWVEALRSGKYGQTTEMLHRPGAEESFCALGLLCKVRGYYDKHNGRCGAAWMLIRDSGLTTANEHDIIQMNDRDRESFATIADYVEANL